jgi:hypothetical protein
VAERDGYLELGDKLLQSLSAEGLNIPSGKLRLDLSNRRNFEP